MTQRIAASRILARLLYSHFFATLVLTIGVAVPANASAQSANDAIAQSPSMLFIATSRSSLSRLIFDKNDLTLSSNTPDQNFIRQLLARRRVEQPGIFTFFAWWVQDSILAGISLNTIVLILLLPFLSTVVVFTRVVIGLPSLEMLVPIALSYALVATGILLGGIILASIVIASLIARMLLRAVPIMFFPKRSLSMLLLSLFVFATLTVSIKLGIGNIATVSIFPILIMTLLGDSLVSIQLHKSMREATTITLVTIAIGVLGFFLATSNTVRDLLILYPETVLILIPINIVMGRYFGLRLFELLRFRSFKQYGSE